MATPSPLFMKRMKGELKILLENRNDFVQAIPDQEDLTIFYFLLKPSDSPYKGGYYIGKIKVPLTYPATAPSYYMLTPSGRFSINQEICLTNSRFHPEATTAAWNINSMSVAFMSIFINDDTNGISHIVDSAENRMKYALNSYDYNIQHYKDIFSRFDTFINEDLSLRSEPEIKTFLSDFEMQKKKSKKSKKTEKDNL
jgi:ubiquitin-conjugating enzyme E2 J2